MIKSFNKRDKKSYPWLLNFLEENSDYDFYVTDNNERLFITDESSLQKLLKESELIYTSSDNSGDYNGIIAIWKSVGGGVKRFYIKLTATDEKVTKDLLTVLGWHTNRDLYVKIRKDNKFLNAFKSKGFRFIGGRGIQILLFRKNIIKKEVVKDYERDDERN